MTIASRIVNESTAGPLPTLIAVDYELTRGKEEQFKNAILPCVRQQSVTLDLSNVMRIDAAGIAALIAIYRASVEAGTHFSVVTPSRNVLEILRILGLETILVAKVQPHLRSSSRVSSNASSERTGISCM